MKLFCMVSALRAFANNGLYHLGAFIMLYLQSSDRTSFDSDTDQAAIDCADLFESLQVRLARAHVVSFSLISAYHVYEVYRWKMISDKKGDPS